MFDHRCQKKWCTNDNNKVSLKEYNSDYGRPKKKSKSKAGSSSKSKSKSKKKKRARVMYDSHLEDESEEDEVSGLKILLQCCV